MAPSYGVYISQLVRYARVCSDVSDFNERNLCITEKLLSQGFRLHELIKTFAKFFRRFSILHIYIDLVLKFGCTCNNLIRIGISHPKFYGDVVNKAPKFKHDPFGLDINLNKLIRKGYRYNIIVRSLYMVFILVQTLIVLLKMYEKLKLYFLYPTACLSYYKCIY